MRLMCRPASAILPKTRICPALFCNIGTRAVDPKGRSCKKAPLERRRVGLMARKDYLFTSESVSEGHPDKVCDRISDEVVDLFFREGPKHGFDPKDIRVACETLATTNR